MKMLKKSKMVVCPQVGDVLYWQKQHNYDLTGLYVVESVDAVQDMFTEPSWNVAARNLDSKNKYSPTGCVITSLVLRIETKKNFTVVGKMKRVFV